MEKNKTRAGILRSLFFSTLYLSTFTFGGGYVIVTLLKQKFVDELHWIDDEEMLDPVAIAQSSPGAIAVNGAIVVGYKLAGIPGILCSVAGAILPPFVILTVISYFYTAFRSAFVIRTLLQGMKADNDAFVIGRVPSAIHSAEAAGYTGVHLIQAERSLDPRMLEFNKQGYLNGHTPFSALAAFASCLTAVIYGRKYVCLSNEASANESTIHGSKVNHQYSKTFEFEQNFTRYLSRYVTDQVHYFSLLRPLSELQITSIFATLKQYHSVFRSCNVGQKEEKWCGHCAKCLFVCIMLSAFLKDEDLLNIFHADMLNDETMQDLFEQLTGILDDKPFECVGTREEVNVAIAMSIRHHEASGTPLPKLYEYYKGTSYFESFRNRTLDYQMWNRENQVPAEYAELIHEKLNEAQRIWN